MPTEIVESPPLEIFQKVTGMFPNTKRKGFWFCLTREGMKTEIKPTQILSTMNMRKKKVNFILEFHQGLCFSLSLMMLIPRISAAMSNSFPPQT